MLDRQARILRSLNPRSIAVIGGDIAETVATQCSLIGYTGELWAVNLQRDNLAGVACYSSVNDLPGVPDVCFLAIPPAPSIETLRKLAAMGAGGAVVYSSGFAEHSPEGRLLQEELLAAAGDMAVIGPNCYGFINYLDRVALWPDHQGGTVVNKGVAIIAQSGNIGVNLTMQERGLPISHVITVGNKAQLDLHHYVDALLEDSRVTAIGLHIEGIGNANGLARSATRALKQKIPLVVLKTGASVLGAELTMSHTRTLSGSEVLATAFFERLGMATCRTVPEFLETLKFLNAGGTTTHARLVSLSCSGGEAALMADLGACTGLDFPSFNTTSIAGIKDALGEKVHISNPLDYHTYVWGDEERLSACFTAVANTTADCIALVLDYPPSDRFNTESWTVAERALLTARRNTGCRIAVVASMAENMPRDARERLVAAGVPPMMGMAEFVNAVACACSVGQMQADCENVLPLLDCRAVHAGGQFLDEWQSKQQLGKAGVPCPQGKVVTLDTVANQILDLKFPLVAKALGNKFSHKSDVGGVHLNLNTTDDVVAALQEMKSLSHNFLVEEMINDSVVELIVGVYRDEQYGLALLVGAGGVGVDLHKDTATLLLPINRDDIARALSSLRIYPQLNGYRGAEPVNVESLLTVIENVAAYAVKNYDCLLELDINPLIAGRDGAIAADVLVKMQHSSVTAAAKKPD